LAQVITEVLPLLPLNSGVILPGMVVTVALESDEARAAVEASERTNDRILLVPKRDGHYARVGTVAVVENAGQLVSGVEALVVRGVGRGLIGTGVAGTGEAVWVQVDLVDDDEGVTERAHELAREYRARCRSS
jgi:ATP-dependent Lon protease